MPKSATNAARLSRRPGTRRGAKPSPVRKGDRSNLPTVYENGSATHVLLPIEEYERLLLAEMAQDAEHIAADPSTKWTDFDGFALEVAGQRIAAARKAQSITQTGLGKKLGIAQAQISRIERNPDRTTLKTLKRIAKALNVDVRQLVG